jgi:hypothetical protein
MRSLKQAPFLGAIQQGIGSPFPERPDPGSLAAFTYVIRLSRLLGATPRISLKKEIAWEEWAFGG